MVVLSPTTNVHQWTSVRELAMTVRVSSANRKEIGMKKCFGMGREKVEVRNWGRC